MVPATKPNPCMHPDRPPPAGWSLLGVGRIFYCWDCKTWWIVKYVPPNETTPAQWYWVQVQMG